MHLLDFRNCGIPDWLTFHVWTWLLIIDSLGKYFLFSTDLFGHYAVRKGVLGMYSVIYPTIGLTFLYFYYLCTEIEKLICLIWMYKLQTITLYIALLCYTFDGILFIFDKKMFCTLQVEKGFTCDKRNEYFLLKVLLFYVFWTPIWFCCIWAIHRFARELNDAEESEDRISGLHRLDRAPVIDIRHLS